MISSSKTRTSMRRSSQGSAFPRPLTTPSASIPMQRVFNCPLKQLVYEASTVMKICSPVKVRASIIPPIPSERYRFAPDISPSWTASWSLSGKRVTPKMSTRRSRPNNRTSDVLRSNLKVKHTWGPRKSTRVLQNQGNGGLTSFSILQYKTPYHNIW